MAVRDGERSRGEPPPGERSRPFSITDPRRRLPFPVHATAGAVMSDPSRGKRAGVTDLDAGPETERRDHRRTLTARETPLRNGLTVGCLRRGDDVLRARRRGSATG